MIKQKLSVEGQVALQVALGWLPWLRAVSEMHGYALCEHGSKNRDIDLVAVPWVRTVSQPAELVLALGSCVDTLFARSVLSEDFYRPYFRQWPLSDGTCGKPHGRLGWIINVRDGVYFDLAVIPPIV